jgi:sugar-phosphatase
LAPLVDVTIARCDYVRAKPAPDAYLAAAAALGLAPGECVVVEDTPRGMEAGRAAGMSVIAAPNDLTFDADFTGCAHRIESLDDLTAALLG